MSLDAQQEQLNTIGNAMVAAAEGDWRQLVLNVTAAANMIGTAMVIGRPDSSTDKRHGAGKNALRTLHELREAMYQEGKGTWYNATFVVDEERRISADFDYENPPFGGVADDDDPDSEGDADPELLLEDHRMFPRDPDVLPEWHPARTAGPA